MVAALCCRGTGPKSITRFALSLPKGKIAATDHSLLQSHVIESWSMSWWGFQKGKSAMMVIVETPMMRLINSVIRRVARRDRAALARSTGTLRLSAHSCASVSFPEGNYSILAKRYRRYVMESGLFVSLKEKIARTPGVQDLIGTPQMRMSILRNLKPDSDRYDTKDPSKNYSLTTFDERARAASRIKGERD